MYINETYTDTVCTQETFSSPRVKLELTNKVKPNSRKQLVIDIKSMNSQKSKDLEKKISE